MLVKDYNLDIKTPFGYSVCLPILLHSSFIQVIFQKLCSGASAADKCTLYSDRNLTNQRNVKDDVTAAANACRSFLQLEVEIQVIEIHPNCTSCSSSI